MSLVCRVAFSAFFLPYGRVDGGKEDICLFFAVLHFRDIEAVGQRKSSGIQAGTADDEDFFLVGAGLQGLFQRAEAFRSGPLPFLSAQHDVAAVGQCPFGERLERLASHDNGMPRGQGLESFQVVGQPIQQFVALSDAVIPVHGCNQ